MAAAPVDGSTDALDDPGDGEIPPDDELRWQPPADQEDGRPPSSDKRGTWG
ncbi:MAG: hypothetical protein H0W46_10365 [Acidimicrobiia bacterium]|nr:hypothetical protein [Acidimicrobiia bacterium]